MVLLASYQLEHAITKSKKSHNKSEELRQPAAIGVVSMMICKKLPKSLKLVMLSTDLLEIKMCDPAFKFTKFSLFLQHLSKLELKFTLYFLGNL